MMSWLFGFSRNLRNRRFSVKFLIILLRKWAKVQLSQFYIRRPLASSYSALEKLATTPKNSGKFWEKLFEVGRSGGPRPKFKELSSNAQGRSLVSPVGWKNKTGSKPLTQSVWAH